LKRLALAAILAIGCHGLLLLMGADWLKSRTFDQPRPRKISLTLSYRLPQPATPPPNRRPADTWRLFAPATKEPPKTVSKPPPKIKPKPRPRKFQKKIKKPAPKPVKQVKKVTKPRIRAPEPPPELPPEKIIKFDRAMIPAGKESTPQDQSSPPATMLTEAEGNRTAPKDTGEKPSPPPTLEPLREAVPLYKQNPPPEYPRLARRRGYQGKVLLEVLVNREGKVEDLRVLQSSGFPVLDRAATASVRRWGFEPGRKGDDAVVMWVKVPVRFQLR